MKGDILILAEHRENHLDNITWELLGKGRQLADQMQSRLMVLLVGSALDPMIAQLKNSGADGVLAVDHPDLADYRAEQYATAIAVAVKGSAAGIVLMGYTYLGMEIGPAAAVRLGGTMVTNCSALDIENDALVAVRPMFGGTLQTRVQISGHGPYLISFEKGVLPKATPAEGNAAVESLTIGFDTQARRTEILKKLTIDTGGIDITKARILVSAGRGIGGPDKIPLIRQLADALGGQMACSRPVADMGWLPFAHQVGISASTVSPEVYIACGISGASQHVTAMRGSEMIIAINKDANAPIFRVAHYGIIGDLTDVIPALIAEAQKSS